YYELSERLRFGKLSLDYLTERKIVFWGFDFFSPLQLDMIKALAIRDEIYLGLYEKVYTEAYSVDWVAWLEKAHTKIIKTGEEDTVSKSVKLMTFPKN